MEKENPEVSQSTILDFHKNGGEGNSKFDVVMNWDNMVRTTSITSILKNEKEMSMRYEDLLNGEIEKGFLPLQNQKIKTS